MNSFHLDTYLSGHVFAFILVFSRIGAIMMLFPGIAEGYVPTRTRLMLAFAISLLLTGVLLPRLPTAPAAIPDLVKLISYEVIIGLFFGTLLRLLVSTLETAGTVVGLQTGLSNATILNPSLAAQSTLPSALLGTAGVTIIFVTGLDHYLFRCFASIYDVFPAGGAWMPGDVTQSVIQFMSKSFLVGIELSMPFFVMGLLMFIALGLMQKLLPTIQMFLIVLPVQIWGGMMLFGIAIGGILTVWLRYMDASLSSFAGP